MFRVRLSAPTALCLLVLAAFTPPAGAAEIASQTFLKAGQTTVADTLATAANTCQALQVSKKTTAVYVRAWGDSAMSYAVQISRDGTHFHQVDIDTSAAGSTDVTADLGILGGWWVRVVLDNLTAGGSAYNGATLFEVR